MARNALGPLKVIANTIFCTSQAQAPSIVGQSHGEIEVGSGNDVQSGTPWFDLFSIDELMPDFMSMEPAAGFSEPNISRG